MSQEFTIPELTEVVARLAALLGPRDGTVVQLEGGITNRNFRVNFGGTDYVVRLPGKRTQLLGIDREAECIANKAAAELGIAPRVAALLDQPSALVTAFVSGREMEADELREPETIAEVAHDLRQLHDSGTELPTGFDSFRLVEEYAETGRANGSEPPDGYDAALEVAHRIEKAVRDQPGHEPVPAHNDLLPANFLRDGDRMQLIDWEYAGMGDRWFDLGNFAVEQRARGRPGGAAARGLLRRAAGRSAPGDAEAVPLHVGLPRGDVGRGPGGGLRARLRLPRLRAEALRPP